MSETPPARRGRPFTYNADFHPDDLYERMARGECDVHIYTAWGVTKKTFYLWMKEHPELNEQFEKGKPAWEKAWLDRGIEYMEKGNDKAYRYWNRIMAVKAGLEYREDKNNGTTVNLSINQMNVYQDKTQQELAEILTNKLTRIPSLQIPQIIDGEYEVREPKESE